jgi:folylpolyglutamate synthase/dihydropteroate synthase
LVLLLLLLLLQVARLPDSPTHYVLDGAHTADSAAALASTLRSAFPDDPVVLLVAMAADKQHRWALVAP